MNNPPSISSTSQTLRPGHLYGQAQRKHIRHGITLAELRLPAHSHELSYFHLLLDSDQSEPLKPFTTIFYPSGVTHHDEIGMRVFSVALQDEWLDRVRACGVTPQSSTALPGSELSRLAIRLYREYLNLDRCSALVIEGLVLEMLALVARPERAPERRAPEWLSRVEDRHRDTEAHRRRDGARMQDLGAERRQFARLVEPDPLDHDCIRHDSRIRGQHAIDISPYLYRLGA